MSATDTRHAPKVAQIHRHRPGIAIPESTHNPGRTEVTKTRPRETVKCPRCAAEWTGLATAHCTGCHETFTTVSAFDKHRAGKFTDDTRHCVDPATVGLVKAKRAYLCWAHAGTDPRRGAA